MQNYNLRQKLRLYKWKSSTSPLDSSEYEPNVSHEQNSAVDTLFLGNTYKAWELIPKLTKYTVEKENPSNQKIKNLKYCCVKLLWLGSKEQLNLNW